MAKATTVSFRFSHAKDFQYVVHLIARLLVEKPDDAKLSKVLEEELKKDIKKQIQTDETKILNVRKPQIFIQKM